MPNFKLWHSCRKWAIYLQLECTHPGSLVARATKFCNMPRNNFITFCTVSRNTYQCTCDGQAVPDKGEVYRLLQNCGSHVWNLLHATLLEPRKFRLLRDFGKIQDDQKVSVQLMATIQKVTSKVQSVSLQFPDIYWHTELCSRRPCSV